MTNHHNFSSKNIIEVGTTREKFSNQSSTVKISKACNSLGLGFTTVDMDPENTEVASKDLHNVNPNHRAVTSKGEDFLGSYKGQISMLYLDAFDTVLGVNHHSSKRKKSYEENLNCDITNELCWKMHLDCCLHAEDKIELGGFICIDDIYNDEDYFGKGKTAIPYLLGTGKYNIVEYMPDAIILKRIK
jgi:hypothetical protein